jgi:hypothetical protein
MAAANAPPASRTGKHTFGQTDSRPKPYVETTAIARQRSKARQVLARHAPPATSRRAAVDYIECCQPSVRRIHEKTPDIHAAIEAAESCHKPPDQPCQPKQPEQHTASRCVTHTRTHGSAVLLPATSNLMQERRHHTPFFLLLLNQYTNFKSGSPVGRAHVLLCRTVLAAALLLRLSRTRQHTQQRRSLGQLLATPAHTNPAVTAAAAAAAAAANPPVTYLPASEQ